MTMRNKQPHICTKNTGRAGKILSGFFAILFSLFLIFGVGVQGAVSTEAAVVYTDYEKSSIENDLRMLGDELFDPNDYPKDANGKHRLLDNVGFMEYAYTTNGLIKSYYGVYFYVYNPTEREVSTRTGANVVKMAVEYNEKGEPSSYENVSIRLLSATENNRFLKFGIVNKLGLYDRARAYASAHDGERRYDIAGIQLWFKGEQNAEDANTERDELSYTYFCTGYCAGCAPDGSEVGTLQVRRQELDTITLDVRHTTFRPKGTNGKTQFTHDSLSSVYFAVPKEKIEKYGEMSGIKGKYLRARTSEIFVTGNETYYQKLEPYIGVDVGYYTEGDDFDFVAASIDYEKFGLPTSIYSSIGYHISEKNIISENAEPITKLNYILKAANGDADNYRVSPSELVEYMKEYTAKYSVSENRLVGGKFHPDLFSEVDKGDTVFDFNDKSLMQQFQVQTITQDWWDKLFGRRNVSDLKFLEDEQKKVIQKLSDGDFENVTDPKAFSKSLYVGESDVDEILDYYENKKQDNAIYLIRFAVDDYISAEALESVYYEGWAKDFLNFFKGEDLEYIDKKKSDTNCYFAKEYVYLNFEIIELRFTLNGNETVIPVVMSPIDVIPGLDPPSVTRKDGPKIGLIVWLSCTAFGVALFGVIYYVIKNKINRKKGEN